MFLGIAIIEDPISWLTWMTVFRIAVGAGFLAVLCAGLYRFNALILTGLGMVMLTNLLTLYILMGILS